MAATLPPSAIETDERNDERTRALGALKGLEYVELSIEVEALPCAVVEDGNIDHRWGCCGVVVRVKGLCDCACLR